MAAKKKTSGLIMLWIIVPLLCINAYAYWQLTRSAEHWGLKLFSSIGDGLTQLALILAVNTATILILSVLKR